MSKAGKAGSTPDSTSTRSSKYLTCLLTEIGQASHLLTTIIVGLNAVENGQEKPDTLNVSWSPSKPKLSARKSALFARKAAILYIAESTLAYFKEIQKSQLCEDIKEQLNAPNLGKDERARIIATHCANEQSLDPDLSGMMILLRWRNKVAHNDSKEKLKQEKDTLLRSKSEIYEKYIHLDVEKLFKSFEENSPKLKEVSCLIAMTINTCRKVDHYIQRKLADIKTKEDLNNYLFSMNVEQKIAKIKRETKPSSVEVSIKRLIQTEHPEILNAFLKYY